MEKVQAIAASNTKGVIHQGSGYIPYIAISYIIGCEAKDGEGAPRNVKS